MTEDQPTYDEVVEQIAIKSAANGGPKLDDVLRAISASHRDLKAAIVETRAYTDEAIAACRLGREDVTAAAVELARMQQGADLDRRAVSRWLSDRTKRGIILAVFVCAVVAAVLLAVGHRDNAADVALVVAIVSPFVLLLYRRH